MISVPTAVNDTACNLASLNLLEFKTEDGFDVKRFRAACRIFITAQEILVDNASYPTPAIAENSHIFRTLGLGYANLGALLMASGLPYDSDAGRALAGGITALMTGTAYHQSALIAAALGPFPGYHDARCTGVPEPVLKSNAEPMLEVIALHRAAAQKLVDDEKSGLAAAALDAWDCALIAGEKYGFRNAQTTVLAPTGCPVGETLVTTDKGLRRLSSLGRTGGAQWQPAFTSRLP